MIIDRFRADGKAALITGGTRGIGLAIAHALGEAGARERDEMIWLSAGEARDYHATFRILDGAPAIAAAEARIRAAGPQPDEDYPEPSGRFPPLAGRRQP